MQRRDQSVKIDDPSLRNIINNLKKEKVMKEFNKLLNKSDVVVHLGDENRKKVSKLLKNEGISCSVSDVIDSIASNLDHFLMKRLLPEKGDVILHLCPKACTIHFIIDELIWSLDDRGDLQVDYDITVIYIQAF